VWRLGVQARFRQHDLDRPGLNEEAPEFVGVLMIDESTDQLHLSGRRDGWDQGTHRLVGGLPQAGRPVKCVSRQRFLDLVEVALVCRQDAQPDRLLDGDRDYPRQAERVGDDNDDREHLLSQQVAAAAVEEAVRADGVDALVPEEAKQERAEDTADEVDGDDVERVVEAEE
jgi:hypothetical protein